MCVHCLRPLKLYKIQPRHLELTMQDDEEGVSDKLHLGPTFYQHAIT